MTDGMKFSLRARALQFASLVERCEMTLRNGIVIELEAGLKTVVDTIAEVRENRRNVYVIGNGGSAAVASHVANDLVNVVKIRATTLHDSSLLTCMANDYGYENAFSRILATIANPEDLLIAISSSGRSMNMCNAAKQMTDSGGRVLTLTGFARDNPLRSLGDINLWLDSNDYGFVEVGHQFALHNISDRFASGCVN